MQPSSQLTPGQGAPPTIFGSGQLPPPPPAPPQPAIPVAPIASAPQTVAATPVPIAAPAAPTQAIPYNPTTSTPAQASAPAPKRVQRTTQNSLLISEIREGMVIMNDGSFRSVVACKSINFDLMSTREREGVEYSYQNFLNALYFPVQIFVRSQRVDIGPYIDKLSSMRRSQDNMLLGVLMDDYINFIETLSEEANIMDKSFFVIIPYYPLGDISNLLGQSKGMFSKIFSGPQTTATRIDKDQYEKAKTEVKNRTDSVMSGLFQIGIQAVQLNTKELGELYYNVYNPDTAMREPLGDFESIASTYVRKGTGAGPAPNMPQGVVQ